MSLPKTMIEGLFDYFSACPLMSDNCINIDYLPEDVQKAGVEYALSTLPNNEVMTRYRDGGARCRYSFVLESVNDYGPDVANAMLNSGFFEQFSHWVRTQSRTRNFPKLPSGITPRSLQTIGHGYLFHPTANAGRYQIQCELEYYRQYT